jgi:hypothetical protein
VVATGGAGSGSGGSGSRSNAGAGDGSGSGSGSGGVDTSGGWSEEVEEGMVLQDGRCDVDERFGNITAEQFYREYFLPGKPVMLRGAAAQHAPGEYRWAPSAYR